MPSTIQVTPEKIVKLTCQQGQTLLIGKSIRLTVNSIYKNKKRDGQRCVQLTIKVPNDCFIYQERLTQEIMIEESHQTFLEKSQKVDQEKNTINYLV